MTKRRKKKMQTAIQTAIDPNNFYVANQGSEQFDELQRLVIAYLNRQPVAIEGEPGLGKNQAINFLCNVLGKKQQRIRCTEEMMARDIIGGEKLAVEKSSTGAVATKTEFSPGKLLQGLMDGEVVILDEVNQLTPTVQKALNSVLEDTRTLGNLEGGIDAQAKDGFGLFLTYNPETGVATDDLEIAVRDRCKLLYFQQLPPELRARIALLKTGQFTIDDFVDHGMELRGLVKPNGTLGFVDYKEKNWFDTMTKKPVDAEHVSPYLFYNRENTARIDFGNGRKQEYYMIARAVVNALAEINLLRKEGTEIGRKLGMQGLDEIGKLHVHPASPRLTNKVIEDYVFLRQQGYKPEQIMGDAVSTIVDYTVPAMERDLSIGNGVTIGELVKEICISHGIVSNSVLLELAKQSKEYSKDKLISDLREKGYTRVFAEKLVREYAT